MAVHYYQEDDVIICYPRVRRERPTGDNPAGPPSPRTPQRKHPARGRGTALGELRTRQLTRAGTAEPGTDGAPLASGASGGREHGGSAPPCSGAMEDTPVRVTREDTAVGDDPSAPIEL